MEPLREVERCCLTSRSTRTLLGGPAARPSSRRLAWFVRRQLIVPIYKYLPRQFADALVSRGEVLFRSLSYFHDLESVDGRADPYEGTLRYRPPGGLEINNLTTGEQFNLQESFAFESTARTSHIFVFCASTHLSAELAQDFGADTC